MRFLSVTSVWLYCHYLNYLTMNVSLPSQKPAHKIITFYRCLILSMAVMGFTMVTKPLRLSVLGVTTFFSYSGNNTDARDTYWSLVRTPPNLEVYLSVMFQESCMLDRNLRPQIAVFIVRNGSELALSRRMGLSCGTIDCAALRSLRLIC
jgi:hypothetical protein